MSESETTQFKVCLKDSSLDVNVGDNVCVSADTNAIAGLVSAIGAATTTLGVQSCLALGGAAAGMFVVAKAIAKHWPFAKTSDVKEGNVIQVSVPPERKEKFQSVVQKGRLQQVLQEEFEDIDGNLEGILGEDAYREYGSLVLDLIRNFRVESINRTSMDAPDGAVGTYTAPGAVDKKKLTNVHQLTAAEHGKAIGHYIAEGANVDYEISNASITTVAGYSPAGVKEIAQANSMMRVSFTFDDYSARVTIDFNPNATVYDAKAELKKRKGQIYDITNGGDPLDDKVALSGLPRELFARKQKD